MLQGFLSHSKKCLNRLQDNMIQGTIKKKHAKKPSLSKQTALTNKKSDLLLCHLTCQQITTMYLDKGKHTL